MTKNIITIVLLLFTATCYSQIVGRSNTSNDSFNARRICIQDKISNPEYQEQVIENTRLYAPDTYAKMVSHAMNKKESVKYEIGERKDFFALNISTGQYDNLTATLKAIGEYTYIWVDEREMLNDHVTTHEIDLLLNAMENTTSFASRDPNKGIIKICNDYFGDAPDRNKDGKVHILLFDIKDGYDGGGFICGFFYSLDQTNRYGSNQCDLLYLDTYPTIFRSGKRELELVLQTAAHEYQHLIHYNYDQLELTFVDEALSQNAEVICGYDVFNAVDASDYFSSTNTSLFSWLNQMSDYSRATLWLLYLTEQVGDHLLKNLVQNQLRGEDGVRSALSNSNSLLSFEQHLLNWNIANLINDKYFYPLYGYDYPISGLPMGRTFSNPDASFTENIRQYGSLFVHFNSPSKDFKFRVNSNVGGLNIKMVAIGKDQIKIENIPIGVLYEEPNFVAMYDKIVIVITNANNTISDCMFFFFFVIALLDEEIVYDNGVSQTIAPSQIEYLFTSAYPYGGWAVKFYPRYEQNILKKFSLSVGFDQEVEGGIAGPNAPKRFEVHVWKSNSDSLPGEDLITPFVYQSYRTELSRDFIEINLENNKEELTNLSAPVFIGFLEDDIFPTGLAVNNASSPYNYSFVRGSLQSDYFKWQPLSDLYLPPIGIPLGGWNIMMRATFTYLLITGVEVMVEELPCDYSLSQNYPNPFNPSTTIEYSLPNRKNVKIEIYDLLGRLVKTLVNETKLAGKYSVIWNGEDNRGRAVSSGVYLYRLYSGSQIITKKLNLIK
jgi:hypothetical protein